MYLLSPVGAPVLFSMPCLNTNIRGPSGVGCLLIFWSHYPSTRQTWPTLRQRTRHLCWRHQPVWDEAGTSHSNNRPHIFVGQGLREIHFKPQSCDDVTREESVNEAFNSFGALGCVGRLHTFQDNRAGLSWNTRQSRKGCYQLPTTLQSIPETQKLAR